MKLFIAGAIVGAAIMLLAMSLYFVASRTDEWEERNRNKEDHRPDRGDSRAA